MRHRIELLPGKAEKAGGGYWWIGTDPDVDYTDDVPEINWEVGFEGFSPSASVGGKFKPNLGRHSKFHQWRDDAHRTNGKGKKILFHASWLAKGQYGVPGGAFGNGGGLSFRVPQGVAYKTILGTTDRAIMSWRCWHTGQAREMKTVCDPR